MQKFKRICSLFIALCLFAGFLPMSAYAEETESRIVKQQLLLGEDLTMRFFANIAPEDRTDSIMHIRVGDRTVRYAVADMTPNEEGQYVFDVDISAPEMTENITVSLEKDAVNGPLKFSGVWFVSKEDFTRIETPDGNIVNMSTGEVSEPEAKEHLQATLLDYESNKVGENSSVVKIGEDPAWGGIASQATITVNEGISLVGNQKSVAIDSPINEGYFSESGATYPLFTVDCAWQELDTTTQDLMFYMELPESSSSIRFYALTCNSWSVYTESKGMQYQYLPIDSTVWQNGTISNDENRTLKLTPGFKGYVRLKIDTASNAASFPESKKLKVQSFGLRGEKFGGDYGSIKLGGVWFVSKEDFTYMQVGNGEPVNMTTVEDRDYLLSTQPCYEGGALGETSTLVKLESDPAWGGIASQAYMKATSALTPLGESKSTVIDSPIREGYFNESGKTYPIMGVECAWKEIDTAAQDVMFYVELPESSSGLRLNSFACNSWSFWISPPGMQYQYLALNGEQWENGTVSDDNNKTLALPQGFKGYIRLKIDTAKNAADFPDVKLKIQSFTFQCDRFGGAPLFQGKYSVRDYAENLLENNYTVETKNLARQMLNYGAKAQLYFGHKTDNLANAGYEVETTATISTTAPDMLINGCVDGITLYGCSVVLSSKLATRYYFRAPKGVDGYTFYVAGKEVTPTEKNGMFYVEEKGITPDRMDMLTTVTVTKGKQELTVQYSPMYYITRMYNNPSATQSMKELLLAAVGYFDAAKVFTGVAENEVVDNKIALAPLYGTQDDLLEYNPDRGWRLEAYVNVASATNQSNAVTSALAYYKDYNPQLCQVYFYLTDYRETMDLPQSAFDRMQEVFDTAREKGIKLLVRFAYESDMEGTGEATDEIMLAHMPQLRPILEKNKEVIHTVEAGFLGAWGEWHSHKLEHDELALLKGILDMVPEDLYVQVRRPRVMNLLADAEPNNPNLQRMGYHDDSFFGWQYARWNDGLNPGEGEWEQMRQESPYAPQGGEMFWGCQYTNWNPTTGELAIRKYSAFHQTSFSLYHSFIEDGFVHWVKELHKENPDVGHYSMRDWQTETVTPEWLEENGVAYDPLWFQDANGATIQRTAFEFVHDHLGYRLRGLDASLKGTLGVGEELQISMNLQNTGFSAAYNMESGFAVLDMDGNVISTVAAGKPASWLPTDPHTKEALTHNVAATLTLPETTGTYQIAFYLKNTAGTGARLANDLPFVNGYTILKTIELR